MTTSHKKEPDSIDFARYRNDELAELFGELFDFPQTLVTLVRWTLFTTVGVWLVLIAMFHDAHWALLVFGFLYGTLAAVLLGLLLGVGRIFATALRQLSDVLQALLDTCDMVASDLATMGSRGSRPPTTIELVWGVTDAVLLPLVEGAIIGQLGFIGRMFSGFYQRLVRQSVRSLLARVLGEGRDVSEEELADLGRWADATHDALSRLRVQVSKGAGRPARVATLIVVSFVALITVFASLPLAYSAYVASVTAQAPSVEGLLQSPQPLVLHGAELCAVHLMVIYDRDDGQQTAYGVVLPEELELLVEGRALPVIQAPDVRELRRSFIDGEWRTIASWQDGAWEQPPGANSSNGEPPFVRSVSPDLEGTGGNASVWYRGVACGSEVAISGSELEETVLARNGPPTVLELLLGGILGTWFLWGFCGALGSTLLLWTLITYLVLRTWPKTENAGLN